MKKVKLTQEQAEVIESKTFYDLVVWFYESTDTNDYMFELFQNFSIEKLAIAKLIGYEVGPKFKVGDWVVHKYINEVEKVVDVDCDKISTETYKGYHSKFRHATEEEIREEKERRWWNKHGRDVWELKEGDIFRKSQDNELLIVTDVIYYGYECIRAFEEGDVTFNYNTIKPMSSIKENYKLVCFAEDRKDMKDDSNA